VSRSGSESISSSRNASVFIGNIVFGYTVEEVLQGNPADPLTLTVGPLALKKLTELNIPASSKPTVCPRDKMTVTKYHNKICYSQAFEILMKLLAKDIA
jgi:hypothetical protein